MQRIDARHSFFAMFGLERSKINDPYGSAPTKLPRPSSVWQQEIALVVLQCSN